MKKTFLLSLAMVLVLGAFGCAREETTTDTAGDTTVTTATETEMMTDTTMTDTSGTSSTVVTTTSGTSSTTYP